VMFVFYLLFKKLQNNFVCVRTCRSDPIKYMLFFFKGGFENDGKKLSDKGGSEKIERKGSGKKDNNKKKCDNNEEKRKRKEKKEIENNKEKKN
ncbi:hypothetical protein RFI_35464, partial [Reticulomyxa filosa]